MAKRPTSFDDKRALIASLAMAPKEHAAAELGRLLADKNGYIAGEAAEAASRLELRSLAPDLAASLLRLLGAGAAVDKGCLGKRRILDALLHFQADAREAYLAGLRYTQYEPAYGGPVDSAASLRGLSAQALVEIDHPDAVAEIAPLLGDPEPAVRADAAQALGRSGIQAAAPLLHLVVTLGDTEPEVLQRAYAGLLYLSPRRYLPVVAAALRAGKAPHAEPAALALGASRLPDALPILKEVLAEPGGPLWQTVLMALALFRTDEAIELLVALVAKGSERHAAAALSALAVHRHDLRIATRLREVVDARGSLRVTEALVTHIGR